MLIRKTRSDLRPGGLDHLLLLVDHILEEHKKDGKADADV